MEFEEEEQKIYNNNETENLDEYNQNAQTFFICFGIIYILIGVTGVVGNALVLYVLTRTRQLIEEGTNSLILCLATNDLMISLCQFISAYSSFKHEQKAWLFGSIGCGLYGAVIGLGMIISILTMFMILLTQICLVYGFSISWLSNVRTCKCIWAISFFLICPSLLGWSNYSLEGLGISCSINWKTQEFLYNYFYIGLCLLGLIILLTLLFVIYVGLERSEISGTNLTETTSGCPISTTTTTAPTTSAAAAGASTIVSINEPSNSNQTSPIVTLFPPASNNNNFERQMFQMFFIMVCCLTISWLPYNILNSIELFTNNTNNNDINSSINSSIESLSSVSMSELTISLTSIFARLNVIFNPIIYLFFHPNFRRLLITQLTVGIVDTEAVQDKNISTSAALDDFRRSSALSTGTFHPRSLHGSIPNSRITPSNSICASHASFNSHHSRYIRGDSRSGSACTASDLARSSISSGGRRPTISSTSTFRQNRTNSSCSSSSMNYQQQRQIQQLHHYHHSSHNAHVHRYYNSNNPHNNSVFHQTEESSSTYPQWRQDWNSRTSQEILLNRFGWAIQRRPSSCCSSSGNSSTVFSPSRHHSKLTPKSSIQSGNGMSKLNYYSEPDLPRFNDRIIKNSGLIPLPEYKRQKMSFWRKSLFLSENCLEQLCTFSKLQQRERQGSISSQASTPQKMNGIQDTNNLMRRNSKLPSSPTNSGKESFLLPLSSSSSNKTNNITWNGVQSHVTNVLTVPTTTSTSTSTFAKLSLSNNINGKSYKAGHVNLPSRSKSMRNTRSGSSNKFLELPARFKRHSDGGVYTPSSSTTTNNHQYHNGNGNHFENEKASTSSKQPSRERLNSKGHAQKRESSIIMVTSPCGDTASVKLENLDTHVNGVDNNLRKLSEISSQYQSCRSGSKKLSFELGELGHKNEWKYGIMHKKECCECSSNNCNQEQYCPSDDLTP